MASFVDYNRDAEHDIINETPDYISQLSDGSNVYTIKDAEARNSIATLANVAISGSYNDLTDKPSWSYNSTTRILTIN